MSRPRALQSGKGRVAEEGKVPRPFGGYGTISGTFAVKGLFAKARKRLFCSISDYL